MATIYYHRSGRERGDMRQGLAVSVDETYGRDPAVEVEAAGVILRFIPAEAEAVALARGLLQAVERTYQLAETKVLQAQEQESRDRVRGGAGWGIP